MAEESTAGPLDSAEKAYAAATEVAVANEPSPEPAIVIPALKANAPAPIEKPAKPAPVAEVIAESAPVVTPAPVAKAKPIAKAKAAAKAAPVAKPAAKKAPIKAKPVKSKVIKAKPAAAKPAAKKPTLSISKSKESIMATAKTKTADFTAKAKEAFADVQTKAKVAYTKGTAAVSEAGEFTKGNLEAVVASGKIVADGLKGMGTDYVAEGKKAYETMTADAKELASVKSPTDFFQLQAKLLRRNFDSVVALTSKNTEAAVKLASDAFAPISGRVSLAVEKVKKAA
ncbi:MAG: phasin family protein [Novosphingobium sp.]